MVTLRNRSRLTSCWRLKWLTCLNAVATVFDNCLATLQFTDSNTIVEAVTVSTKHFFLPEQSRHGVAADVVQGRVVLVLLSVRCIRVQAVPELRVAFIELPGQGLVATHQGLAELGGCVAHGFKLAKGLLKGAVADARLPSCLRLPRPRPPPPPFTTGHKLRSTWFSVFLPWK